MKALQRLPQVLAESTAAMAARMETSMTRTMDPFTRVLRERGHLNENRK